MPIVSVFYLSLYIIFGISNDMYEIASSIVTDALEIVINELPKKCIVGMDGSFGDLQLFKETILKSC